MRSPAVAPCSTPWRIRLQEIQGSYVWWVVVRLFRTLALAVVAAGLMLICAGPSFGARTAGKVDGAYIVLLEGTAGDADAATDDLQKKRGFRARLRFRRVLRGFAARLTAAQVERLREDPAVASVSPDRPVRALGEVDLAPGDTAPAGVLRLGAASPGIVRQASTVNVAVLDSGIDLSHPDLNAVDGTNCVTPGTPAQDDNGHGTQVAGTISANNDGRGVVGVAPGTRTHAVKVLDAKGNGTTSEVICGIEWVTRTRADADPANDIAVVNLSLGGTGSPVGTCPATRDPLHRAICASTRAGVTYVAAAGNEARDFDNAGAPDLPAAYPEVLTVSAMSDSDGAPGARGAAPACRGGEADDVRATFSSYATTSAGAAHTVAAPGVCIRSTRPGGGYATSSGTSMAAPHIAGAVALCLGEAGVAGPCAGLSPAGIIANVRATAGRQDGGHGFVGDPLRPFVGQYFGPLAWAGIGDSAVTLGKPVGTDLPVAGATPPTVGSATAAPAPSRPAPAIASLPLDRTAPVVAVAVRMQRLRTVLRRGLSVMLRCSEGCVATAEVWLPGPTAKRLGLSRGAGARIAPRSRIRLAANARKGVVLKLSRSARVRLARTRGVAVRVKITVVDAAGNRRAVTRKVTIRR